MIQGNRLNLHWWVLCRKVNQNFTRIWETTHCYKQLPDQVKIFSLFSAGDIKGAPLLSHLKQELQGNFFLEKQMPTYC